MLLGLIAQAEYDVAEARFKRVVASIDVARFALKEAEVAVDNTRIIAPFDGTVLKKNADVGEIVAPLAGAASSKAAVVTIADMSSLEVDADVSEANITRVAPEQQQRAVADAHPLDAVGVRLQAAYAQPRPDGQPWTARTLAEAAGCGRSSAAAFLQRQRPPTQEQTS